MNLVNRIERLEARIGVSGDEPLIIIDAIDCRKDSQDEGTPLLAIVPGKIGGPCGVTLIRDKDEDPGTFLERCASKHTEFYV